MTWEVPDGFINAVAWFLDRIALTAEEAFELRDAAKRQAFWLSGVSDLSMVSSVFDDITSAISHGLGFKDIKQDLISKLIQGWGSYEPVEGAGYRAETIYHNAIISSLNGGRYEQMKEVSEDRPYWMFDAIMDTRTSDICRPLDGIIRRHDDEWWSSHYPPLHHRCRSGVRSLREKRAKQQKRWGEKPPKDDISEGWGNSPGKDPGNRKIQAAILKGKDGQLAAEFKRKQKKAPKPAKPPARKTVKSRSTKRK